MFSLPRILPCAAGCLILAFPALACRAGTGVIGSRILLGQSVAFSGPAARLGIGRNEKFIN